MFKRIFIGVALLVSVGFIPFFASAQTVEEQIAALQAQVQALLQQIERLKANPPVPTPPVPSVFCYTFLSNLRMGDRGVNVENLTIALVREGLLAERSSNFSSTFDDVLAKAVIAFQEKYSLEILASHGITHGTGFVGASTRTKLNALYGCGIVSHIIVEPPPPPVGPTHPPVPVDNLSASPTSLSFTATQGASSPSSQKFTVGYKNASWIVAVSGGSWLSTDSTGVTYGGSGAGDRDVIVYANQSGLSPGTYTGTVTISGQATPSVTVNVTLTVTSPETASAPTASLSVTPSVVSAGQNLTYTWSSANASSWSWGIHIYDKNGAQVASDGCSMYASTWSGPPGGKSASGSGSGPTAACQAGYSYTIFYTAKNSSGQTATKDAQVTVQPAATTATSCSLSFSKTNITVGDTVTWTANSSTPGFKAYWYGKKNETTDAYGTLLAGTTNFTQNYTYTSSDVGTYTRYLVLKDSSGSNICTTNTVNATVSAASTATIPTASLSVTPSAISAGQNLTYTWSSANASSWSWSILVYKNGAQVSADGCGTSASNWSGPVGGNSASGSWSGPVATCQAGYSYTILYNAKNSAGQTAVKDAQVNVSQ